MATLPIEPTAPFAVYVRGEFQFDASLPESDNIDDKNQGKAEGKKGASSEPKRGWIKRLRDRVATTTASEPPANTSETELESVKSPFALRDIDIQIPRGKDSRLSRVSCTLTRYQGR